MRHRTVQQEVKPLAGLLCLQPWRWRQNVPTKRSLHFYHYTACSSHSPPRLAQIWRKPLLCENVHVSDTERKAVQNYLRKWNRMRRTRIQWQTVSWIFVFSTGNACDCTRSNDWASLNFARELNLTIAKWLRLDGWETLVRLPAEARESSPAKQQNLPWSAPNLLFSGAVVLFPWE